MDDIEDLISDCEARADKLSEWEANFIQSVREQFDKRGSLTDRQYAKLSDIWEKVT